ncbi:MAG: hypothetical protein Q7P63_14125 [Verrucomicrobiota bacterium JB022]|nr:hypothetical protein [Verrucomicrobiota bacterium JB022]
MSIRSEVQRRRRYQLLLTMGIVCALFVMALGQHFDQPYLRLPLNGALSLSVVLITSGILFSASTWRCPACQSHLGHSINPSHCRGCGRRLR